MQRIGTPVFERYEEATELLGVVFRRRDGYFKAVVFEKANDPQWALPWWAETYQDGIYATETDAIEYIIDKIKRA